MSELAGQAVIRRGLLVLGLVSSAALAAAQPPPVGPPANTTQAGILPVPLVTDAVRERAQESVDETNARLEAEGKDYRASIDSITVWGPYRSAETNFNRPNSSFVRIPHMVRIKVDIPWVGDRFISIPIDVNMFCDNWHLGTGTVVARSKPGPAAIEGGGFLEEVLHVKDYVDAQVRASFTPPMPATEILDFLPGCFTIGADNRGTSSVDDDLVVWDVPFSGPTLPGGGPLRPMVEVTFNRLTRLPARRIGGGILYNVVETFSLNLFANYAARGASLTMQEGDSVALRMPPAQMEAARFERLVVIGSVEQAPWNPKDSAFASTLRTLNYSPGTYTLQIPKWYSQLDPRTRKIYWYSVPAYELTYTVRYIDPVIIH